MKPLLFFACCFLVVVLAGILILNVHQNQYESELEPDIVYVNPVYQGQVYHEPEVVIPHINDIDLEILPEPIIVTSPNALAFD